MRRNFFWKKSFRILEVFLRLLMVVFMVVSALSLQVYSVIAQAADITISNSSVAENEPGATLVGTLFSDDPDPLATFSLEDEISYPDNALFDIADNQLITTAVFDFENIVSYLILVRVTDQGGLLFEKEFTITVTNVNEGPIVSDIPDQTIAEGDSFTTITLDNYVSDVDNADMDMTWTFSGNIELIVDIDVNRVATISIPNPDWNGTETITFRATDPGTLYSEDAATFTVTAENDAPIVTDIPNQTIAEGASFTTITLDDYVSDVDNLDTEMTWSYTGTTDLTMDIDVNRVATIIIPNADWNGAETITIRATDPGTLYSEDAATFTVTAVNDGPIVSDIPNQTIAEGASFATISLDNYVSDVDNLDTDMTWTYTGNTQLAVSITNRVATISIPNPDWNGAETITFRATDQGTLYSENAATFTVTVVNDAPIVSDIPHQTIVEGASFATITLDNYVSDVDNLDNELVWTYTGNTQLAVSIINRVATISIPNLNWNGAETITFRATDPGTLYSENTATFTVTAVNDAPVITSQVILATQKNVALEITLADLMVTDVDNTFPIGFTLTVMTGTNYTLVGNTITPTTDFVGTLTVPVKVNDVQADSNTFNLSVKVTSLTTLSITNTYGQTVFLQAYFQPSINNKTVDFTLNGMTACSALSDSSGWAYCTTTLLADFGTYPVGVSAVFSGDAHYDPASATAQLIVLKRDLTVSATGVDKPYDGTTAATIILSDNHINDDVLLLSYTSAVFSDDANVGTDKSVYVRGISISGPDVGNYRLMNTTANTTADILAKEIMVTADSGQFKLFGQADPVLTYSYSPNDPPVVFTGSLERDPGEDIGTYVISQGSLTAGDNYAITFISDQFSIVIAYNLYLPMVLK